MEGALAIQNHPRGSLSPIVAAAIIVDDSEVIRDDERASSDIPRERKSRAYDRYMPTHPEFETITDDQLLAESRDGVARHRRNSRARDAGADRPAPQEEARGDRSAAAH